MALRSKNFLFNRKDKDGEYKDFPNSDVWYPNNVDYYWDEQSTPMASGGYYGSTTGLHTISFTLREFTGRIYVLATLASNPTDQDWFPIKFKESCKWIYFFEHRDMVRICNVILISYPFNYPKTFLKALGKLVCRRLNW